VVVNVAARTVSTVAAAAISSAVASAAPDAVACVPVAFRGINVSVPPASFTVCTSLIAVTT
jgi:hypothetical protein